MLKQMFALSDQGSRDLNKGIAATTLSNLCLIAPVSLLVMVIWELLNVISGQESSMRDHAALFICGTVVMFIIVFLTQWLQYNKTYTVAYKESANRRIVLAEKLRKLPLSFFGQRDLSDLTTTIMGDCTALERVFSNAIPQLFGTIFMFIITAIGLLVLDWRMGLCIVVPVPVAALVVFAAKKAQSNAESANMDAKRAAYDGVQEYLDTIQELKSCSREEEYLEGLEKKLDYVVKCSFRNEIAPGAATTTAQFILRFGLVAVMLVGGILVTAGSLSIPMFILFLLFAGRIYDPFTSCFMLMAEVFSALVSVKRMKQIDATRKKVGSSRVKAVTENQWTVVEGAFPSIITQEIFDTAKGLNRGSHPGSTGESTRVFYRKIRCGHCGLAMERLQSTHPCYVCRTDRYKPDIGCPQDKMGEKELEQAVLASIRTMAQLVRGAVQTKQRQFAKDTRYNHRIDRQIKAHQNSIQMRQQEKMAAFEDMVSGKVSSEDYQHKRGQCEKHIQRLEIKIKELEATKRQTKEEELSADSILPYTNVRTLTRELVDLLIQNIYIFSSTSIEIVWKCGDEYQRLLADTAKKEAVEHEQG